MLNLMEASNDLNFDIGEGFNFDLPFPKYKGRVLSLNVKNRMHFHEYREAKNKYKSIVSSCLNNFDVRMFTSLRVTYRIWLEHGRTIDLDNLALSRKFIQDALTDSGFIHDDNATILSENREIFCGFTEESFINVELEQMKENNISFAEFELPKLNKNNHFVHCNRVFRMLRKDETGKPTKLYIAYRDDGMKIHCAETKEELEKQIKERYVEKLNKYNRKHGSNY